MKKLLVFIISFALLLPSFSLAAEEVPTKDLEKVPSISEIKNFQIVKKIGDNLYGVRINKAIQNAKVMIKDRQKATSTNLNISAAKLTKDLQNIKEKGAVVPKPQPKKEEEKKLSFGNFNPRNLNNEQVACIQSAIDNKDASIKNLLTAASVEQSAAIDERNACQKLILTDNFQASTTDSRPEVFQNCAKKFNEAIKSVREKNQKSRETIWNKYKEDMKNCRPKASAASSSAPIPTLDSEPNVFFLDGGESLSL